MQIVYTDGSSIGNGKKDCVSGCGVYFEHNGEKISISSKKAAEICKVDLTTESNNIGELMAIFLALVKSDKNKKLTVYSDSMYCINSITNWYKNWEKNGWITSSGDPVKNKDLLIKIIEEKLKFNQVEFLHVKGHKKEPFDKNSKDWLTWNGNSIADYLATTSIKKENCIKNEKLLKVFSSYKRAYLKLDSFKKSDLPETIKNELYKNTEQIKFIENFENILNSI
jgi:ribonuclease HI